MFYYNKNLINLDKNASIAHGNCRNIFLYDNKCIKVSLNETLIRRRDELKNKNKIKWLFKPFLMFYNENYYDLRFYRINSHKKEIFEYIPKFYGICKTNLGIGLVVEYMVNKDNSKMPTIKEYINENGINNDLLEAIKKLWTVMLNNNVQIRAPHAENFLVKNENNNLKIYMIDGFGSPNLIPLLDYVPSLGKKKILKKFNLFIKSLKNEFPNYTDSFDKIHI